MKPGPKPGKLRNPKKRLARETMGTVPQKEDTNEGARRERN
jgi:hypothetical protein